MVEANGNDPKRCADTRKDGTPCTAPVMGRGTFCFAHDPARATERQAARQRGWANSATQPRLDRLLPATLKPMIGQLLGPIEEVYKGDLDSKRRARWRRWPGRSPEPSAWG